LAAVEGEGTDRGLVSEMAENIQRYFERTGLGQAVHIY